MKLRHFTFLSLFISFTLFANATPIVETVSSFTNKTVVIDTEKDLHITATNFAMVNSTVNLATENSWLFFDNIKPSNVLSAYGNMILINGQPLVANKNARVSIYAQGTVIIPQNNSFQPLEVFTDVNYTGESAKYNLNYYYRPVAGNDTLSKSIGAMDNKISSFKLKRGYMATLGNSPDGTEYSRVFIADKEDINIPQVQAEFQKSISFIRVMRWEWPTKKGWAGWIESDFNQMDATWFYTWGADQKSTINSEFVPERHHIDWPSFGEIGAVTNVTHLLGLNEPDHSEQANAMVADAVAEAPRMLATGLRVGSPAATNFSWLYDYMARCKALNYRIDFVAIHAYWGGMTPQQWYNTLKDIYVRTGRPLWITEWNNGANWTNETWPSGVAAQQQKQLNDLKGILQVMDTASFVERYSIYNWVEDKRAMILPDGSITPAGIYYRDNKSVMAYNSKYEVIPVWTPLNPTLAIPVRKKDKSIELSWKDINGGLVSRYIVERQVENEEFKEIAQINDKNLTTYVDKELLTNTGYINYRVKSVLKDKSLTSNVTSYYLALGSGSMQYGNVTPSNAVGLTCAFQKGFSSSPVVVSGITSYNNSLALPLTQSIDLLDSTSFVFRLVPWLYLNNPVFTKSESVSFLSLAVGKYQWGSIHAQANLAENINGAWKTINFAEPFETTPVVFASQVTNRSQIPTAIDIKNVTKTGFQIQLVKEDAQKKKVLARENVTYIAATPGVGNYGDKRLIVGITAENSVGGIYYSANIAFNESFVKPALFASMQTANDTVTCTLRYNRLWTNQAIIFKSRESSMSNTQTNIAKETVGWMVLETDAATSVNGLKSQQSDSEWKIYPNPVGDVLYVNSHLNTTTKLTIYNMLGEKIMDNLTGNKIDVSQLPKGFYILNINNSSTFQFFKK